MNIRKAVRLTPPEKGFCLNNPNMSLSDGVLGELQGRKNNGEGEGGSKEKRERHSVASNKQLNLNQLLTLQICLFIKESDTPHD